MDQIEMKDSADALRTKIIHGNPERYRRAIIAVFTGQIILLVLAWVLLTMPSLKKFLPTAILQWFVVGVFVVNIVALSYVLIWKKLHLATSILAIVDALFFIPTLFLTGGCMSPFAIMYLLVMLLSIIMVDVIPPVIGKITSGIIIFGYAGVSIAQYFGFQPVVIEYIQPIIKNKAFFWFVFTVVFSCFIHGYFAVYASSKNVRDTLTQLIMTYRYVARGTSIFAGGNFFKGLLKSLKNALQVETVFLIDWAFEKRVATTAGTGINGRLVLDSRKGIIEQDIVIDDEFRNTIERSIFENKHSLKPVMGYIERFTKLEYTVKFGYWSPVYDTSGKISGILCVADPKANVMQEVLVSDVMQIFSSRVCAEFARRLEEQKRMQMQSLLAQGQKMQAIGQLSSSIAHDFNNILNGIFGFASLINRNSEKDSSLQKYAGKILQLGKSAGGLISQLLAYSRQTPSSKSVVQINQIVDECVEIVRHTNKKRINIEKVMPDITITVNGDSSMIQSAVLNLLINAGDAIEQEGQIAISISSTMMTGDTVTDFISGKLIPSGNYVLINVEDNGCGIPEDKLLRIFEPFYTTKGSGHGTGLGLAAVYGCMEAHRGFIAVESTIGNGSSFSLYFPEMSMPIVENDKNQPFVKSVDLPEIVIKEKPEQVSGETMVSGFEINQTRTVMIVDDELSILESLSEHMSSNGYSVIACDSGYDAIEKFKQNKDVVRVVILDMILPDIKGKEVFEQLKKINANLPVIVMTGYSTTEDLDFVNKQGVVKVFFKPFEFRELDKILRNIAIDI